MKRTSILVVMMGLAGWYAIGAGATEIISSGRITSPITVEPDRAPGDPVNLTLDDGSAETNIGVGGTFEFLFLNRYTPVEFPVEITNVQVYFDTGSAVTVGDPFDVYLWANPTGNTDPATGAVYAGSQTGNTISAFDVWIDIPLTTPIEFAGPGDVVVGIVHRVISGFSVFPATLDSTLSQTRSWVGFSSSPTLADPPTLPPDGHWSTIDTAGYPGNFMVRASGSVVPVELMSLSIE